ncbi:MAG: transcriptional regulator, MarR family [Micrococcaceae bacterium]|jgi:DNA-binding MarR family transcriptional regulator|nr:transcriptional regulator, MarR family [Micrococcaceae bacterium]
MPADPPHTAAEVNTGLLLYIPYRALEARVFDALASAGFGDITPAQARVFQRIDPEGTRVTELAERAQITKQTASTLVQMLEEAGYVRRVSDPADARARRVEVAERGLAALPIAAQAVSAVEAEWAAALGKRQYAQLRRALLALRTITDPYL